MLGAALSGLVAVEEFRGSVAGWLMLTFGLAYTVWGIWTALRNQPHAHAHVHLEGTPHNHRHVHDCERAHVHAADRASVFSPWLLFLIFIFGPCEPLIPLLMYPAATSGVATSLLVAAVFSLTTLGTMLCVVTLGCLGVAQMSGAPLGRYAHATCGAATAACGAAICLGL